MKTRNVERSNKFLRIFKNFVSFPSHTRNQVHPDKRIGNLTADFGNLVGKQLAVVMTAHQLEHGVAARLQRNMEMRHKALRPRNERNDFIGQQVGFNRRNAVAFNAFHLIESLYQIKESFIGSLTEVTDIDAGNHDFLTAFGCRSACLLHKVGNTAATATATCPGNSTIAAIVVAAVLHFQEITGTVAPRAGRDKPLHVLQRRNLHHRLAFGKPAVEIVDNLLFLVIAHHNVNTVDSCHLLAFQLSIAAGHDYYRFRIFRSQPPDFLTAFLVGKFCHRTGIHHTNIRHLAGTRAAHSPFCQHLTYSRRFRKVQFAPQRVELHGHISESSIVNHCSFLKIL